MFKLKVNESYTYFVNYKNDFIIVKNNTNKFIIIRIN